MHTTRKSDEWEEHVQKYLHENLIWKFIFAKTCLDQANQDFSIPKTSRPFFIVGEKFCN